MMKIILTVLVVMLITGCASEQSYRDYTTAYSGWTAIKSKQEVKNKELLRIEAVDGQPITITAKTFVVYMPNSKEDDNTIPPPQQIKDSEWVKPVTNLFNSAAQVGLAAIVGNTASNIVGSLANAKGSTTTSTSTDSHNTSNANQANTDSHDSSNANQANSSTTSTSSTDSHNSTTSTDSHNTTSTAATTTTSTPTTTTTTTGAAGTTTGGTVTQ